MSTVNRVFAGSSALSSEDIRVLGCLLEKQRTTPDAYPLTLNALRLACNQATNRDPVVDYEESLIRDALHRLERRGLVRLTSGRSSRTAKYRHLLAEALPMSPAEQSVMCVLMLRGPQTPGELKQRTERMCSFGELDDVLQTLTRLIERGLVARLERRPGQKEDRYAQLLQQIDDRLERGLSALAGDTSGVAQGPSLVSEDTSPAGEHTALVELYERVARLEREVAELRGGQPASRPAEIGL